MKAMRSHKSWKSLCIYSAFALFYFWMAAQVPYTHDDWDWGLTIGLHQLIHATVNSRYAGNLCEVIMTRSEIIRVLIMGLGYFLIPYILTFFTLRFYRNHTEHDKLILFIVSNCVLLSMDRGIWAETYGWTAGYANFVISALVMMIWISEIQKLFVLRDSMQNDHPLKIIVLFLLSIISQLFLENLAIFHALLAIVLCVIHFVRNRSIPGRILLMTLGAVVGLFIMFSSSLYNTLFSDGSALNGYRDIPFLGARSLSEILYLLIRTICILGSRLYARNVVLCYSITAALVYLLIVNSNQMKKMHFTIALGVNLLLMILLPCCLIFNHYLRNNVMLNFLLHFPISILFFLSVTADVILLFWKDPKTIRYLSILWFCIPIIIAPLIVTTEFGPRLFFNTNVYLLLFLLSLLSIILRQARPIRKRTILHTVSILAAVLVIWHGYVYANIGAVKWKREAIIRQSVSEGASHIVLPAYPFSDYLHYEDPTSDKRMDYFKEFYGIPNNVDLVFGEQ